MYSTAFWCLFVVLLVFLALLRNHCYSFTSFYERSNSGYAIRPKKKKNSNVFLLQSLLYFQRSSVTTGSRGDVFVA